MKMARYLYLMLLTSSVHADQAIQTDWSAGWGAPGPVSEWGNSFYYDTDIETFSAPGSLSLSLGQYRRIENGVWWANALGSGDIDGDGDMDIVIQSAGNLNKLRWLENLDGSGTNWEAREIDRHISLSCLQTGDIDSDGDIDVAGASYCYDVILWYLNVDGSGKVWGKDTVATLYQVSSTCLGDIDGDGDLDILGGCSGTYMGIFWWENESNGSKWPSHTIQSGSTIHSPGVADVDGDGDLDFLGQPDWDDYSWWENADGAGLSWVRHSICSQYNYSSVLQPADVDRDGDVDVVGLLCSQPSWWENVDGSGTLWNIFIIDDAEVDMVHCADLDNDNDVDIAFMDDHYFECEDDLGWWENSDALGTSWIMHSLERDYDGAYLLHCSDINNDGSFEVICTSRELSITGCWDIAFYAMNGLLDSSILDIVGCPQWDSISWVSDEPRDTDIFFQLRASNYWQNMGAWSDPIFEPQSLTGIIDSTFRYIQYRVGMTSDNEFVTPVLHELSLYWTYFGIEGEENGQEFSVSAYPNPSPASVSIMIPPSFIASTEILVYDISGKLVRRFTDLETNIIQWDCDDDSGREVPSGVYLIQGISGDISQTIRVVRI